MIAGAPGATGPEAGASEGSFTEAVWGTLSGAGVGDAAGRIGPPGPGKVAIQPLTSGPNNSRKADSQAAPNSTIPG